MLELDRDRGPVWIRRCRIFRLERCSPEGREYAVYRELEPIGYVRELHLQDWAYESPDGRVAAGYADARSAANRLIDVLDSYDEAPQGPAHTRTD